MLKEKEKVLALSRKRIKINSYLLNTDKSKMHAVISNTTTNIRVKESITSNPNGERKIKPSIGNSLSVQWLGLEPFTVKAPGSIPGQRNKILQAMWCGKKNKTKQNKPLN